jgi:hypothetical protein
MGMWQVSYLAAAEQELETLPRAEQVAIQHAVEKLQLLGIRLPSPALQARSGRDRRLVGTTSQAGQ